MWFTTLRPEQWALDENYMAVAVSRNHGPFFAGRATGLVLSRERCGSAGQSHSKRFEKSRDTAADIPEFISVWDSETLSLMELSTARLPYPRASPGAYLTPSTGIYSDAELGEREFFGVSEIVWDIILSNVIDVSGVVSFGDVERGSLSLLWYPLFWVWLIFEVSVKLLLLLC